jgi:methylenetetrahydrofolate reductase (NADPH)
MELICEVEPPTRPDLTKVRHQIGVLSPIADGFLIPDNHIGRATVSSVAVANEVQAMGARGIACLNSRDRNLLGLRRDLLTAAAYGVEQFLFVHGDAPSEGARTSQLTVRTMLEAVERDPDAGVEAACEQVLKIRDSGAFEGVHLVPVSRYRQVSARLEREL